jgi:hypothetical protein
MCVETERWIIQAGFGGSNSKVLVEAIPRRELEKRALASGGYDKLADALLKAFFTTEPKP